jgi:predicted CoA-binding protein
VRAHLRAGFEVYPVNPHETEIEGLPTYPTIGEVPVDRLDRVTIYVPPEAGMTILPEVARKGASEVWLNPGADSPEVVAIAESLGLNVIRACSILAIGESPH